MNARWISFVVVAAIIATACSDPGTPEITEVDPVSPYQAELDALIDVDVEIVGEGSVTRDVEKLRPGRPITLTAVPELGSQFVSWSGDESADTLSIHLQPDTDVALTATFEPIPPIGPEFTIEVDGEGWVSRESGPIIAGDILLRAIPASGWEFTGWTGMVENATNPVPLPMRQDNQITAHFRQVTAGGPVINVWGGLEQRFDLGIPQRWINIRGNVADNGSVSRLEYSLNDAPVVPLTIGPDRRRLQDQGDFNIELDTETLPRGRNDLVIVAFDNEGNSAETPVTVDFVGGEWPLPYQTNWGAAGAVEDQAQVVDGIWTVGEDGIRTAQVGYDRIVAIGDQTWTDYEAEFTVTIHAADARGYDPTSEPFVGFVLRWNGHSVDGTDVPQPRWYYWPAGTLGGYYLALDGTSQLRLESNESIEVNPIPDFVMEIGDDHEYNVKVRVKSGETAVDYRLKVWEVGTDEPREWNSEVTPGENDAGPDAGSLLLIAHYFDVTFGDVTVSPI